MFRLKLDCVAMKDKHDLIHLPTEDTTKLESNMIQL